MKRFTGLGSAVRSVIAHRTAFFDALLRRSWWAGINFFAERPTATMEGALCPKVSARSQLVDKADLYVQASGVSGPIGVTPPDGGLN